MKSFRDCYKADFEELLWLCLLLQVGCLARQSTEPRFTSQKKSNLAATVLAIPNGCSGRQQFDFGREARGIRELLKPFPQM